MNYGLLKTVTFLSMTSVSTFMVGRAIINTYIYDIFAICIGENATEEAGSYMCRNANDLIWVFQFLVAAVLFFGIVYLFTNTPKKLKKSLMNTGILTVLFFGLLVATWRLQLDLQDNFFELVAGYKAPETFNEYAFKLFDQLASLVVGIILGFMVWLPGAVNRHSIDPSKRKEPRLKFTTAKKTKK